MSAQQPGAREFPAEVRPPLGLSPSETCRRVVRETYLAALKSNHSMLLDAWALANASELLR